MYVLTEQIAGNGFEQNKLGVWDYGPLCGVDVNIIQLDCDAPQKALLLNSWSFLGAIRTISRISKMPTEYFPPMTELVCRFQSSQCVNLCETHAREHTLVCLGRDQVLVGKAPDTIGSLFQWMGEFRAWRQ